MFTRTLSFAVLLFALLSLNSPALAQPLTGTVSDADYATMQKTVTEKIQQLEKLGGGTKPFLTRLDETNKLNDSGSTGDALTQLKSLGNSVDDQLKTLTALRNAPKKVAVKAVPSRTTTQSAQISGNNLSTLIMSFAQTNPAKAHSINYASFHGTSDDYAHSMAKDILSRELGGLKVPCEGPFRLERFRNVQRISEMRKQGQSCESLLSYHYTTEEIASAAKTDGMRVSELSQRVRYLEQQLGLSPLQSSLTVHQY